MYKQRPVEITKKTWFIIGIALLMITISTIHSKTGYIGYDKVRFYGWPFPVFYCDAYYTSMTDIIFSSILRGGFMIFGFSASLLYWYGISHLLYSLFLTGFPDFMTKYLPFEPVESKIFQASVKQGVRASTGRYPNVENEEYDERLKEYLKEQYKWRGLAYLVYGFFEFAVRDFDKVIKLKPEDAKAYYRRGYANSWINNHEKAIQDYNVAIGLDPDNARYWYLRGKSNHALGRTGEAVSDLRKAIELDPMMETAGLFLREIE